MRTFAETFLAFISSIASLKTPELERHIEVNANKLAINDIL
ncbi:MAG: hypothetical protein ACTSQG_03135 [Promethearchaeota archaeon]